MTCPLDRLRVIDPDGVCLKVISVVGFLQPLIALALAHVVRLSHLSNLTVEAGSDFFFRDAA